MNKLRVEKVKGQSLCICNFLSRPYHSAQLGVSRGDLEGLKITEESIAPLLRFVDKSWEEKSDFGKSVKALETDVGGRVAAHKNLSCRSDDAQLETELSVVVRKTGSCIAMPLLLFIMWRSLKAFQ